MSEERKLAYVLRRLASYLEFGVLEVDPDFEVTADLFDGMRPRPDHEAQWFELKEKMNIDLQGMDFPVTA